MAEQSIRVLASSLEAAGQITHVRRPVDPACDLAAVARRVFEERGTATLFDDAAGWRVASTLLAARWQWAMALGVPEAELLRTIEQRLDGAVAPVTVAADAAPVTAARQDGTAIDLARLPFVHAGAGDDAGQIMAVALARDPDGAADCIGLTRHRLIGRCELAVIGMSPALERLMARATARGRPLALTLAIGAAPALYLAAAIGTWRAASTALAGALAAAPLKLLEADSAAAPVPAEAELVMTGAIMPGARAPAGRLATVFGVAMDAGAQPVMTVETLCHRADPQFHVATIGTCGDLAGTLALAAEALTARHIRNIEGGIDFIDIVVPPEAGGQVVVVKLRGRVEGQTKTALMGALSGAANWFKLAIAIDEDVNAADLRDVFWSVASRTHAEKDVALIDGLRAGPGDIAAADRAGARVATRWFIDSAMPPLTQPERRESFARAVPRNLDLTDLADFLPPR